MEYHKLSEGNYLVAENVDHYRHILAFCYQEKKHQNSLVYRSEIFTAVQQDDTTYTEAQLDQELAQLVAWGNLNAKQEMSQPKTIAEFKNKFYRYQISPIGSALEEMLQKLPQVESETGSIEAHLFERLLTAMKELANPQLSLEARFDAWDDVTTRFSKLDKQADDYVSYLNSQHLADQMQTTEFLAYKTEFVSYLRDFIHRLQGTILQIQQQIAVITEAQIAELASVAVKRQPPKLKNEQISSAQIQTDLWATWLTIKTWFCGNDVRESEYHTLERQTNLAISRMTRLIQTFAETLQQHHSRRAVYLKAAEWFMAATDDEIAANLATYLFGFAKTRHLQNDWQQISSQTDDLWQLMPSEHLVHSSSRQNQRRVLKSQFQLNSVEKHAQKKHYLLAQKKRQQAIMACIQDQRIELAQLDQITPAVRRDLLRWLGMALLDSQHKVKTEIGLTMQVKIDQTKSITLRATDGTLILPATTFYIV